MPFKCGTVVKYYVGTLDDLELNNNEMAFWQDDEGLVWLVYVLDGERKMVELS